MNLLSNNFLFLTHPLTWWPSPPPQRKQCTNSSHICFWHLILSDCTDAQVKEKDKNWWLTAGSCNNSGSLCESCTLFHPTCILGPLEDGLDLVAPCGVTLGSHSSCAHAHRACIGFDSTEECCGCSCTVRHLCISVVRLWSRQSEVYSQIKKDSKSALFYICLHTYTQLYLLLINNKNLFSIHKRVFQKKARPVISILYVNAGF